MRIISLAINNFRLFKNTEFFLGKYMTIFSGTNAVGKSTLLGILGNSSELKVKDGKPIIQKQFRTEFSEIFKMSRTYDKTAPNVLTINFSDGSSRVCRITWQKKGNTIVQEMSTKNAIYVFMIQEIRGWGLKDGVKL